MTPWIRIVIILTVVAGVLVLLRPRPLFVVAIEDGKARVRRGKVPEAFIRDCDYLSSEYGIRAGVIQGFWGSGKVKLQFSRHIPEAHHQRFRNVWNYPAKPI
jgi:hypothetical protein